MAGLPFAIGMALLHLPVAWALFAWLRFESNRRTLGRIFVGVAAVHNVLAIAALPRFDSTARYSGFGVSAPLFAFIGAALFAALLWAAFEERGLWRTAAVALVPSTVVFIMLSAQRSGILATAAAGLPFLIFGTVRRPKRMVPFVAASIAAVFYFVSRTNIFDFAFGRFESFESGSRNFRFAAATEFIRERPVFGWGAGFTDELGFGVHNAFLAIGVDLGLVGLGLWVAAILIAVVSALRFALRRSQTEISSVLLGLSWLGASVAYAQVEVKLYRPTNLPSLVFLLAILLIGATTMRRPAVVQRVGSTVDVRDRAEVASGARDEFDPTRAITPVFRA